MEKLEIGETIDTPYVLFDPHLRFFELSGKSFPENTIEFYTPLIEWFKNYSKDSGKQTNFNFKLKYFSSSSYKPILDILNLLQKMYEDGEKVNVTWYYKPGDTDLQESGEEFASLFSFPFSLSEM